MRVCEIIFTYHNISWISFIHTQELFEQHIHMCSDTVVSIEFHQLQKQIAWLQCGYFVLLVNKKGSSIKLDWFVPLSKVPFIISRTKKANEHGLKKSQQVGLIEVGIQTNPDTGPFRKKKQNHFSDLLCVTTANRHQTSHCCAELSHRWDLEHIPCIIQHVSWRGNSSNH